MANVRPFQPYRYSAKAGDLSDLVTQPYDKIPDELRERYLAKSPYNFVRLIKGKDEPGDGDERNVYARAAGLLDEWIAGGVLEQDPQPAFYVYSQEFQHPETGARVTRQGFIGLIEVEEYEKGVVHRHELTHRGPKVDRYRLTDATQAYFGQLFFLYDDPTRRVDALLDAASSSTPLMQAAEEGVVHRVWRLDDPQAVAEVQQVLAGKKLLIADGHHRYETALAYARDHPQIPGASFVMATLVNMSSEGVVALATHRLISGLAEFSPAETLARIAKQFDVARLGSPAAIQGALDAAPQGRPAIGLALAGDAAGYLLTPKGGGAAPGARLDVAVLHEAILDDILGLSEEDVRELKGIQYVRGTAAAVAAVEAGQAQLAFLLRPVNVKEVAEISFAGGVMPQKSTDFYPKLLSGFATYRFGPPTATAPKDSE